MDSTIVKRYGNDIYVDFPIFEADGSAFKPSGATIRVELRNSFAETIPIPVYDFSGNNIRFWVLASELKAVGSYDLWIEAKRANALIRGGIATYTYDKRDLIKIRRHS